MNKAIFRLRFILPLCASFVAAQELNDIRVREIADRSPSNPAPVRSVPILTVDREFAPSVDLNPEFDEMGPSKRNQYDVGACHDFSAISLLEAAYFRHYKDYVPLSEADLFIQSKVLTGKIYESAEAPGAGPTVAKEIPIDEGGSVLEDVLFAIQHGVLKERDYLHFLVNYDDFRYQQRQVLSLANQEMKGNERLNPLQRFFAKVLFDPRKAAMEEIATPEGRAQLETYLENAGGRENLAQLARQRELMRQKLSVFRVVEKHSESVSSEAMRDSRACAAAGVPQGRLILRELNALRPVAVSMIVGGMPEWGFKNGGSGAHAFTIVGYDQSSKGIVFHTRNSWGPKGNYDLPQERLCRIYRIDTVLTPEEVAKESR